MSKPLLEAVRPVVISVVALGVVACAMAAKGWHAGTLALGGMLVLFSALLVFQVHRAISRLHSRSISLEQAAGEAELHYVSVLRQIATLADGSNRYYEGHSARVGKLCRAVSARLGLDERLCELMDWAGQLHDLGMLAIPERILAQRGKVDGSSLATIQSHSDLAYQMLRPLRCLEPVLPAIRHHHERMNGTGYPAALSGEQIPLEARIIAAADAYDAMTHDRPQRNAISPAAAIEELRRCCPSGFDPRCVEALAEHLGFPKEQPAPASQAAAPTCAACTV